MTLELNLQNGLVGHWTLDEKDTSNGTAYDSSAYNNHGSLNGSLTTGTSGIVGEAYSFDGTNDEIRINNELNTNTVTVSQWIKPGFSTSHSNSRGSVTQGTISNFGFYFRPGSDAMRFFASGDQEVNFTFNQGEWIHIVGTYDINGTMEVFKDGVSQGTDTAGSKGLDTSGTLVIGSENGDSYWIGDISEVRIYDRVLSKSEILSLYNMRSQRTANI